MVRQGRAVVLGAGPAGLAAADALAAQGLPVLVLEASSEVGGLSRTVEHQGFRFDIGGHRFFTRYPEVEALWREVLGDELMVRPRLSRILYRGHLFDYPLRPGNALVNLGPVEAARCMASFGRARLRPRGQERSFEEWVSNRFGDRLFEIFFRTYTEKVWGMPCAEISADWAAQRIKNLSLGRAVRAALLGDQGQQVTSLVEQFLYPRLGPGQMFEGLARRVVQRGGELRLRCRALGVEVEGSAVRALRYADEAGQVQRVACSALFSSIPLTSLVLGLDPAPPTEVQAAARALRFRHMISVNLMVEGEGLFPDNWVYVHSPELKVGRIQNYGNWSPHMVPGPGWSGLGLEYFSQDGDALWEMSDSQLLELARRELGATGLCRARVVGGRVVRAPRAYPVYHRGYEGLLGRIIDHVRPIAGLYPMGRYGMFKYNNSDHSIHTGLLSVQNHLGAQHDIWSINADEGYHEERPGRPGVG